MSTTIPPDISSLAGDSLVNHNTVLASMVADTTAAKAAADAAGSGVFAGNASVAGNLTVNTVNGAAYPPPAAGGGQTFYGSLAFDTDGSGDPQTFEANVLVPVIKGGNAAAQLQGYGGAIIPAAGVVKNLRVQTINAAGVAEGCQLTVTVYKNGVVTTHHLTYTADDIVHGPLGANPVAVVAGNLIQIFVSAVATDDPTNPQSNVNIVASVDFIPS